MVIFKHVVESATNSDLTIPIKSNRSPNHLQFPSWVDHTTPYKSWMLKNAGRHFVICAFCGYNAVCGHYGDFGNACAILPLELKRRLKR
jgi:hypothetical protein